MPAHAAFCSRLRAGLVLTSRTCDALLPSRRLKVAALSGASAVALGAYGAHALRPTGPDAEYYISTFDRASRYHLTHSLLIAAAPLARCARGQLPPKSALPILPNIWSAENHLRFGVRAATRRCSVTGDRALWVASPHWASSCFPAGMSLTQF